VQPLVTYYLFFGRPLFEAVAYLFENTLPFLGLELAHLIWIFSALVIAKCVIALGLAWHAWRTNGEAGFQKRILAFAEERKIGPFANAKPKASAPNFLLALRDLLRPLFLISLLTTGIFLYFSQKEGANIAWLLLRPVAIAFVFFYFSRTLTLDRWLARTRGGRLEGFGFACQAALERIRRV
jgi:hypothetical protein